MGKTSQTKHAKKFDVMNRQILPAHIMTQSLQHKTLVVKTLTYGYNLSSNSSKFSTIKLLHYMVLLHTNITSAVLIVELLTVVKLMFVAANYYC